MVFLRVCLGEVLCLGEVDLEGLELGLFELDTFKIMLSLAAFSIFTNRSFTTDEAK